MNKTSKYLDGDKKYLEPCPEDWYFDAGEGSTGSDELDEYINKINSEVIQGLDEIFKEKSND